MKVGFSRLKHAYTKLLYILWFILALFVIVLVAGIYRFNFTDDDLYIEVNGTILSYGNH